MGKAEISKFKLKLPKNKQLIQDLEPVFQQIEALQNDTKLAEQLYKQLIQELSNEAIPNSQQLATLATQTEENDTEEIQIEELQNEIIVPKKIKKVTKKANKIQVMIEEVEESDI